nr:hypothetical protein [Tanacetum cinerariifolium]
MEITIVTLGRNQSPQERVLQIGIKRDGYREQASLRNTFFDPSEDLSKYLLASLAISPFYDDPYIKVMQAYNATSNESLIPPQAPIAPPTGLPSSPVLSLSPMFDPRDFFLLEEILPFWKRARFLSSSSTDSSAPPQ